MKPDTKVILAADAISFPLTGIGRYAYELASRLPGCDGVDSLRLFSRGRWVGRSLLDPSADAAHAWGKRGWAEFRAMVASSTLATRVYGALIPRLSARVLKHEAGSVFHSPNYFLPEFPGVSVATVHDLSHVFFPQFHPGARVDYLRRQLPLSMERADFLITDAESVKREIVGHFSWPADRIEAIPLGVDPSFMPRAPEQVGSVLSTYGLTPGGYVLYVGTIEPRKNLAVLLQAYGRLPESLRRRKPLVFVGARGWLNESIFEAMERAGASGWLRYLRYVPQEDLPSVYAGAHLFAFPSIYEGFGLPPLEAMASGVPVVASSAASLPEVVGDAGMLVDPQDVDGLTQALRRGIEDAAWRQQAIAAGLLRAKQFSWERCAQRTVEVYRRASA